jgi:hypothetical protein
MGLPNKSSVHKCGGNILSSILDIRQLTNIKQIENFCLENVGRASACLLLVLHLSGKNQKRQAEARPTD